MPRYKCIGCGEIHNDNDYSKEDGDILLENKCKTESMKEGLWLTAMGRIVLDDHGCEAFSEPGDIKLFTAEQISNGVGVKEFEGRLFDALLKKRNALSEAAE